MSVESIETVDLPTRRRVVDLILNDGPQTAKQLAERLHLTPAAVRRHLAVLLTSGALTSHEQRVFGARGRGRPSKVFVLTDAGRAEFRQAYDDLAIAALRRLAVAAGPSAIRGIAEDRVACIEERFSAAREADPERPAVEILVEALAADGYAPSIRPVHSGEQLLSAPLPGRARGRRVPDALRDRDPALRQAARHPRPAAGHHRPRRRGVHHARAPPPAHPATSREESDGNSYDSDRTAGPRTGRHAGRTHRGARPTTSGAGTTATPPAPPPSAASTRPSSATSRR